MNLSEIVISTDPSHEIILDYGSVLKKMNVKGEVSHFLFLRTTRSRSIMHSLIRIEIGMR